MTFKKNTLVPGCTKAVKRLQTALSSMAAAGLGEGSLAVTAANDFVYNLNVGTFLRELVILA